MVLILSNELNEDVLPWIIGSVIAFLIIISIQGIFLYVFRGVFFQNLYRKNVLGANIMHIVLEAWSVALSVGYVAWKIFNILLVCTFFLARVDQNFLAPGVGKIGPLVVDELPDHFRRDLVVHEAHRHPYIEMLGMACLIKLRAGDGFGRHGNSCWRVMLVLALMPWLSKYRINRATSKKTSVFFNKNEDVGGTFYMDDDEEESMHKIDEWVHFPTTAEF